VLRSRESPSGARIVTLLSREEGLSDAFVFGGPKSRLRSLAVPYHEGRAWIYRDTQRGFDKLSDFDAASVHAGVREHLSRLWAAALFTETMTATSALGGEHALAFELVRGCIERVCEALPVKERRGEKEEGAGADPPALEYAIVQFAQRVVASLGVVPPFDECAACSRALSPPEAHWYSRSHGGFVCPACAGRDPGNARTLMEVAPGSMAYLRRTAGLSLEASFGCRVESSGLPGLAALSLELLGRSVETPLRTLERPGEMW